MKLTILMGACVVAALCTNTAAAKYGITTKEDACSAVKARASNMFDQKLAGPIAEWSCGFLPPQHDPGYFVLRLNARPCRPNECASNLLGWYAVRESDGRVFEWDMANDQLGKALPDQR
ncbi:MAG TPA: hypothetical protein VGL83_09280 [Stellaceae bacterium]|jgi:hypothetical protein